MGALVTLCPFFSAEEAAQVRPCLKGDYEDFSDRSCDAPHRRMGAELCSGC